MHYTRIWITCLTLSMTLLIPQLVPAGESKAETPVCEGQTYFSCICPGDKVCPAADGEYDFPYEQCANPQNVTPQNIDNLVGNLRLADPPCKDPAHCRRISVHDASAAPQNNPACRCREKIALCKPKS